MYYSYIYTDPISAQPIYVGKGKDRRAWRHFRLDTHLGRLLRKRLRQGYQMIPQIIRCATERMALALEVALIKMFGRSDTGQGTLINYTDGGEGVSGYRHTPDCIRLIREARYVYLSRNRIRESHHILS